MLFLIGIPVILVLSTAAGFFMAYKMEDTGIGKVYAVLVLTLGIVVLVALYALQTS